MLTLHGKGRPCYSLRCDFFIMGKVTLNLTFCQMYHYAIPASHNNQNLQLSHLKVNNAMESLFTPVINPSLICVIGLLLNHSGFS